MKHRPAHRLLLALAAAVGLLFALLLVILLTDTLVNIWHNLREAPLLLQLSVATALFLFSLFSAWLVLRLLKPRPATVDQPAAPPDRESLEEQLSSARDAGLDVGLAEAELSRLEQRKQAGQIHVALFGQISSGKSSLIRALLPDSETETHVLGGTTRKVREYHWRSPAGDVLVLTDMPGLDEAGGDLDLLAREEALRAHIVIYVVEGDLTRNQADELSRLLKLEKPTIVALNKIDQLSDDELAAVSTRLQEQVEELGKTRVVAISAGATVNALRLLPDGSEERIERTLEPRIEPLRHALQQIIDSHSETLDALRDSSVFVLVSNHLDQALGEHRRSEAQRLVSAYAKKAVVGAIAAMTPGTDILIQGYLATQLIRELSRLYEVPLRKVDLDLLLDLIQQHVRTHTTVLLAMAGNALKAFPGAGTLAGGALHAVAYGLLFDALGKSVAASLDSRGELHPLQVVNQFEDTLGEDIRASAKRYARLAFEEIRRARKDS